jgi:hypothetical protein
MDEIAKYNVERWRAPVEARALPRVMHYVRPWLTFLARRVASPS